MRVEATRRWHTFSPQRHKPLKLSSEHELQDAVSTPPKVAPPAERPHPEVVGTGRHEPVSSKRFGAVEGNCFKHAG
jgi:hypothetical protein